MTLLANTIDTPLGPFTAIADDGVVVTAGFGADAEHMQQRLDSTRRSQPLTSTDDLGPITAAIRAYFAGDVGAIDTVPVDQPGGQFRTAAWKAMRAVPAGETISYGELAAQAGSPGAGQAAGSACSQNRIAVIVPCHRIVQTGGGPGGYYYGLDIKAWLLAHERGEQTLR
ncbi:MAG: methylated-DNA--[protein]-cysteine S-methyltransferase [Mycobacteriales bacterium]